MAPMLLRREEGMMQVAVELTLTSYVAARVALATLMRGVSGSVVGSQKHSLPCSILVHLCNFAVLSSHDSMDAADLLLAAAASTNCGKLC